MARPETAPRGTRQRAVAVAAAALLVAGCAVAGWWLTRRGAELHLGNTFPVTGRYDLHLSGWLLAPLLVAAVVWRVGPRAAARMRWPRLLLASYLTAVAWAVALALVGGPAAITHPLTTRWEYLAEVDRIDAMGITTYLATFTEYIVEGHGGDGVAGPGWANHVAGHPPLLTLLFVVLARAGLAGPGAAAALCIGVGAAAVPAVLATLRLLAGEGWARRAAPFVAAAPLALWVATSADAIIAGVAATGIATLAHAAARTGPVSVALAGLAGVLLGGAVMLSYGMVLLAPIAIAVVIGVRGWREAWHPLGIGAAGALAVLAGFAATGFWWLEGLALTSHRVRIGEGWSQRPTGYFVFANPAALAVAIGPAVIAALPQVWRRWREPDPRRLALPAVAALAAMALATASTLSKGEVERIWLPFVVWLLALAALLQPGLGPQPEPGRSTRGPERRRQTWLPRRRAWFAAHLGWPILVATGTTLSW